MTLAAQVLDLLKANKHTLALAESCTGGLLAKQITDVPGASDVFLGAVVAYANDAKTALLHVRPETIASHGAVSETVAGELANGVKNQFRSTFALSTTGIAGPTGGSAQKPVGLVCFGLSGPGISKTKAIQIENQGRDFIRQEAARIALSWLLETVKNPR